MLNIISCAYWPSVRLLWESVKTSVLYLIRLFVCFFFILGGINSLYNLAMKLCQFYDLQVYSPIQVGFLFVLCMVSFFVQKLLL